VKTCNRLEFYIDAVDDYSFENMLLRHWALESKVKESQLGQIVQKKHDSEVVEHLIRLGSGLESMLVGEPQILGQLKQAIVEAQTCHGASTLLVELFEKTMKAASKIRDQTGIGRGTVSIGSAAVRLAEETLGDLKDQNVLLIGTGHVGMLVMKALRARDVRNVIVAGRTREHVQSLCRAYGGIPILIKEFLPYLKSSKLVIVATSAKQHLLTHKEITDTVKQTVDGSKIVILDLSNPRNVSPELEHVPRITLKTLEDLRGIAEATLDKRRQIMKTVQPLVVEKTKEIIGLLKREEAEPIVSEMYQRAEHIRTEVLQKTLSKLSLGAEEKKILENMTVSLVEKILDKPAGNLRKAAERGDDQMLTVASNILS
jgi:glutamyl-tRNA reductase